MTNKDVSSMYALVFFLVIILFSSCQKEQPVILTDTDLITDQSWRKMSTISNPPLVLDDGTVIEDLLHLEPSCILDNTFTFTAEGEHFCSEGANICSWNEPMSAIGEWRIQTIDGVKMLDFDYNRPNGGYKLKIVSLTDNALILEYVGSLRVETTTYVKVQSSIN